MRQRSKTPSMALAAAAERPCKVRCQTQPAEDRQFTPAPVQANPRNLGEFDPRGQIPPQRLLIGAPAGAQRSGSGGERRKERSLSGIFGFSRKWSGGVSSDDMGGAMNQPSSWLNPPRPSGREKASPGQSGQPSLKPRQKTWREPPSQPGSHPPRPGEQTPESPRC